MMYKTINVLLLLLKKAKNQTFSELLHLRHMHLAAHLRMVIE